MNDIDRLMDFKKKFSLVLELPIILMTCLIVILVFVFSLIDTKHWISYVVCILSLFFGSLFGFKMCIMMWLDELEKRVDRKYIVKCKKCSHHHPTNKCCFQLHEKIMRF